MDDDQKGGGIGCFGKSQDQKVSGEVQLRDIMRLFSKRKDGGTYHKHYNLISCNSSERSKRRRYSEGDAIREQSTRNTIKNHDNPLNCHQWSNDRENLVKTYQLSNAMELVRRRCENNDDNCRQDHRENRVKHEMSKP